MHRTLLMPFHLLAAAGDNGSAALYVILTGAVCFAVGWWLAGKAAPPVAGIPAPVSEPGPQKVAVLEEKFIAAREEAAAAAKRLEEVSATISNLESRAAAAEAARETAQRERDTLRSRVDAAEDIHRRSAQRDSDHQKTLDALAAAELNLKAARIAETQATERAARAEASLARVEGVPAVEPGQLAVLEKQLGETRRLQQEAETEAAALRQQLGETRSQLTAFAGDASLAALRAAAGRAEEEKRAAADRTAQLQRELDSAIARIAQLEAAAVTLQSKITGPPPELAEARAAAERARAAQKSAEDATGKIRQELEAANARARGLESTLNATRQASASLTNTAADLAEALRHAETLKDELKTARDELKKLKSEGPLKKPRPILTSPRPAQGPPVP
jgi:chromosome segregation ATPase